MPKYLRNVMLTLLLFVGVILLLLFMPLPGPADPDPAPAESYADAVAKFEVLAAADAAAPLYPGCESHLLTHGEPTARAIVLFHGYRNCPLQFLELGEELHAMGYNVLIPRMPHMGYDAATRDEHSKLTTAEIQQYAAESYDILAGLGDELTAAGLSAGGAVAAWGAQNRAELDDAMVISPFFSPGAFPAYLDRPLVRIFSLLPNRMLWQDSELQENVPNPPQVYPNNSTRALANLMRFGFVTRGDAQRSAPRVRTIVIITNNNDGAVDREPLWALMADWERNGIEEILAHEFPRDLALDHDLIDPMHPKEQIELVYPVLIDYFQQTEGME